MLKNRIVKLREELDLSQKELAEKLNINVSVMNRIESGDRPVRDNEIIKLANFFNVSTDYLLGKSNVKTPIQTVAAHMIDPNYEFTEEEEADIRDYIEYIKSKAKAQRDKRNK